MPRTRTDTTLVVLGKAPLPGTVKTRLIPLLGAEGAAALHARLFKKTLATARAAAIGLVELHAAPDIDDPFLRYCSGHYGARLVAQRGADLGERLYHALRNALRRAPRAVVVGTDCAVLAARHLRQAAGALQAGFDSVIAPAEDGGYALLGLNRCDETLFSGIAWGEDGVLSETRNRLSALGWRSLDLETLWDVDRPQDYRRLLESGLLGENRSTTRKA